MPVQTDNTTAVGVVNKTLVSNKLKSMDPRYHWLRCRIAQDQLRLYGDKVPINWGDYSTTHHPLVYHEYKRPLFTGAATRLYQALSFGIQLVGWAELFFVRKRFTMSGLLYRSSKGVLFTPIIDPRVHMYLHVELYTCSHIYADSS